MCEHLPNIYRLLGLPDKPGQSGSWMFPAQTGPPAPSCILLFSEHFLAPFYFFRKTLFQTWPVWAHFSKTENRDSEQTVTDFLRVQRSKLSWPFSKSLESASPLLSPRGLCLLFKGFSVEVGSSFPPPCCSPFSYCCKYRLSQEGQCLWCSLRLAPCFKSENSESCPLLGLSWGPHRCAAPAPKGSNVIPWSLWHCWEQVPCSYVCFLRAFSQVRILHPRV